MLKRTEKATFIIPSCKLDKQMFKSLSESFKGLKARYVLNSEVADIVTDDIELFVGSEWPTCISRIKIEAKDTSQGIRILLDFRGSKRVDSKASIFGADPVWVNGMAGQLQGVFRKSQNWYDPVRRYWQIRLLLSLAIILILGLRINLVLWQSVKQSIQGITELQCIGISSLLLIWLVYPLNKVILWLFPSFELKPNRQKTVRKLFWFILVLLIGWMLTEFLFPQLLP